MRGLCAELLELVLAEHDLVLGEAMPGELRRVLERKLRLDQQRIAEIESGEGVSGYYVYMGIPKARYDAAAELKDGQKVVMTARAQRGGGQMRLFVQSFEPVP